MAPFRGAHYLYPACVEVNVGADRDELIISSAL